MEKKWVLPQPLSPVIKSRKKSCENKASYIANVFVIFLYIKEMSTKLKILSVFLVVDITVLGCALALEFVASRLSVQHKKTRENDYVRNSEYNNYKSSHYSM